jgi:hypothetical protein
MGILRDCLYSTLKWYLISPAVAAFLVTLEHLFSEMAAESIEVHCTCPVFFLI